MTVLLVRHAHAGDRGAWEGDDRRRPLSEQGWAQARSLVGQLVTYRVGRILSSEYDRCVQTVEPLGEQRGLPVEHHPALLEGAGLDRFDRLWWKVIEQDVVLCSHGDLIEALITDLQHRGVDLGPDPAWPKASVWLLEGAPDEVRATYLPPSV